MKNITEYLVTETNTYPQHIIKLCEKIQKCLMDNNLNVELDLEEPNPTFYIFDPKSKSKDTLVLTGGLSPKRY